MKRVLAVMVLFAAPVLMGCSSSEPSNIVEGVSQSEVDEYNRLLKESQAGMVESDAAQAAYDKNPKKKE